jgi:hypothetical protein
MPHNRAGMILMTPGSATGAAFGIYPFPIHPYAAPPR